MCFNTFLYRCENTSTELQKLTLEAMRTFGLISKFNADMTIAKKSLFNPTPYKTLLRFKCQRHWSSSGNSSLVRKLSETILRHKSSCVGDAGACKHGNSARRSEKRSGATRRDEMSGAPVGHDQDMLELLEKAEHSQVRGFLLPTSRQVY
jgi:hypothetical protein